MPLVRFPHMRVKPTGDGPLKSLSEAEFESLPKERAEWLMRVEQQVSRPDIYRVQEPMTAFLCGDGMDELSICRCGTVADYLCDAPMGEGKTCDAPLCVDCAVECDGADDYHLCAFHAGEIKPAVRPVE